MYQRRTVLQAGVTAAALAVAGCTSQDGSTDPTSGGTDDGVVDETDDAAGTDTPDENTDTDTETEALTETETEDEAETGGRVRVISSVGLVADGAISAVELVLAPAPGAGPIDLSQTAVQWIDEGGSYDLAAASADSTASAGDGTFRLTSIKDGDGSAPVMNTDDDRMQLSVDLGTADEVSGVQAFGEPLEPGESATVQLTLQSGAETTVRLNVPDTLADQRAVVL